MDFILGVDVSKLTLDIPCLEKDIKKVKATQTLRVFCHANATPFGILLIKNIIKPCYFK